MDKFISRPHTKSIALHRRTSAPHHVWSAQYVDDPLLESLLGIGEGDTTYFCPPRSTERRVRRKLRYRQQIAASAPVSRFMEFTGHSFVCPNASTYFCTPRMGRTIRRGLTYMTKWHEPRIPFLVSPIAVYEIGNLLCV